MQKWQYGLAVYTRNDTKQFMKPVISVGSATLPMDGIAESECLHLDVFLRKAGSLGWELASVCEPFPAGMGLAEEGEDGKPDRSYTVGDPGEIQWFIFKRPQP